MTYFAKDEMRITLGSLLNIFMSLAIKGRLFIAVWHKNLEELPSSILLQSFWYLLLAVHLNFQRKLAKTENCNLPVELASSDCLIMTKWILEVVNAIVVLFSSPSTRSLNSYADDVLHVFLLWTETMMMKRAWRDLGSNLEKFSYLHSDLSSNDVLLVIFSMDHTHRTL